MQFFETIGRFGLLTDELVEGDHHFFDKAGDFFGGAEVETGAQAFEEELGRLDDFDDLESAPLTKEGIELVDGIGDGAGGGFNGQMGARVKIETLLEIGRILSDAEEPFDQLFARVCQQELT